jgi:hypothetical protein
MVADGRMKDTWKLLDVGTTLSIQRAVRSARGDQSLTLVYDQR